MTHDYEAARIHRADLDREIETIRTERLLAADGRGHPGLVDRARRKTGNVLIAAGRSLAGPDTTLGARRA